MNNLYAHSDGVLPYKNNHVVLVLKKNRYIGKKFVAGIPGGVFSPDGKENGEGKLGFNPLEKSSFCSVYAQRVKEGLATASLSLSTEAIADVLAEYAFNPVRGCQKKANATKELVEETGLVARTFVSGFEHSQYNKKNQQQNFFITDDFWTYKFGSYVKVEDLNEDVQIFLDNDPDIDRVIAVHVDDIFNHPDFMVIPTHVKPLKKAISFMQGREQKVA